MNRIRHASTLAVLVPVFAAINSTAGILYEHGLRKSLFSGVVSGEIYNPRALVIRSRTLKPDEVASLTQYFLLRRTEWGDAVPGWIPPVSIEITYANGTTARFNLSPEDRVWESLATGRMGLWRLRPGIDHVLPELMPEDVAEPDVDKQRR